MQRRFEVIHRKKKEKIEFFLLCFKHSLRNMYAMLVSSFTKYFQHIICFINHLIFIEQKEFNITVFLK